MIAETKGLVLRQVKTINGRRVLRLFTEKYGKISAGVTVSERGRGRAQQALHPFTYGNYELFISRGYYNLNKGQAVRSFYDLGADVDKYMAAAYGLELCDKLLEEDVPAPDIFALTVDFLITMEERKSRYETLLLAYKVKLLSCLGMLPVLDHCALCGTSEHLTHFSVKEGSMLCRDCAARRSEDDGETLIYEVDFVILGALEYMLQNSIGSLKKLALDRAVESQINTIIDRFITYHLDPGDLKAGAVRIDGTEVQKWKSH